MAAIRINRSNGASNGTTTQSPGASYDIGSPPTVSALTEYGTSPQPDETTNEAILPSSLLSPSGYPDYLRLILTSKIYEVCEETPLTHAINLSNRLGCKVILKREDLQPVFSFKIRGAYNRIAHIPAEERWKGVIACSAGNHAQGVAFAAQHLKIPATIVMPEGTPSIKHKNVSRMGAKVVLYGPDFDAAKEECARLEKVHGLINIPPYDDPYVIAGQGTIGMEILRQTKIKELEAIFCCVGGGGLVGGIAAYVKRIAPQVKIYGVETFDACAMKKSMCQKRRVVLDEVGLFADGAAVKVVGEEPFRLCQAYLDDIILVTTDEVCAAIKDVFEDTRSIVEPAGALAVAGLKKFLHLKKEPPTSSTNSYCAILSGANMNFDRLRFVAERAALGEQKEAFMLAMIPERPGSFLQLISVISPRAVTEFSYRYSAKSSDAAVYISFAVNDIEVEVPAIIDQLRDLNMTAEDLSENELAKSHARYMAGGRQVVPNERLFRFGMFFEIDDTNLRIPRATIRPLQVSLQS